MFWWSLALAAGPLELALVEPEVARTFDYCSFEGEKPDLADALQDGSDPDRQRAAALVDAGLSVAQSQGDRCAAVLRKGDRLFDRALKRGGRAYGQSVQLDEDPEIAAVQQRIHDLWSADQAARHAYVRLQTDDRGGAEFWAQRRAFDHATAADQASTGALIEILDSVGWPDQHRYGGATAAHAWLLAQHADDHPNLQERALELMAAHVETGGVKNKDYAYLWDRVAVNSGRKQRYGTQPLWDCLEDGSLALAPTEDLDGLDARREAMGMGPVEQSLAQMAAEVCR